MPAEMATVAGNAPAKRRNKGHARVQIDKRHALGRRVKELAEAFTARLGPDANEMVLATAIRRCAETVALSEHLRARLLRGVNEAAS
jgi:hypothetical protein